MNSELLIVTIAILMMAIIFLIIGGIGYIAFAASIWAGIAYIIILIALLIYFLFKQTEKY